MPCFKSRWSTLPGEERPADRRALSSYMCNLEREMGFERTTLCLGSTQVAAFLALLKEVSRSPGGTSAVQRSGRQRAPSRATAARCGLAGRRERHACPPDADVYRFCSAASMLVRASLAETPTEVAGTHSNSKNPW